MLRFAQAKETHDFQCDYVSFLCIYSTQLQKTRCQAVCAIGRGGRYYRKKLLIADKSASFKVSLSYRYRKFKFSNYWQVIDIEKNIFGNYRKIIDIEKCASNFIR